MGCGLRPELEKGKARNANEKQRGTRRINRKGSAKGNQVLDMHAGRGQKSHLSSLAVDAVEDGLEGRIRKAGLGARLFVSFETAAHALRAVVEGVAEGLMDGLQTFATGHKDLVSDVSSRVWEEKSAGTRSFFGDNTYTLEGGRACPGMGSDEDWFV